MNKELYIRNISLEASEEDVRKLFSVIGEVLEIRLVTDTRTGHFVGSGYVEMANETDARAAMASLNGARLLQRTISITEAQPKPPARPKERPGGKTAREKRAGERQK